MKWKRSSDAVQRPKKGGSKPRKKPAAVTASKRSVVPAILLGSWLIALTVLLAILFMNMDQSKTGEGRTVLIKKIDTTRTPRPPEPSSPSASTADPAPATRPAQPAGTVDTTTTTSSSSPEPTSPPSARPEPASPPSATPSATATSTPSATATSTPPGQATPTPPGQATPTPPATGRLAERVDRVEEKVAVVDEIRSTVDRVADEVQKQGKTLRNLDKKVGRLENAVSSIETGKPAARAQMPDSASVRTGATSSSPAIPEPRKPAARTGTRPKGAVSDRAAAEDRRSVRRRIARREAEIRRTAPDRKAAFGTQTEPGPTGTSSGAGASPEKASTVSGRAGSVPPFSPGSVPRFSDATLPPETRDGRRSAEQRIARREAEIRRTAPERKEAFRTRRTGPGPSPKSSVGAGFPAGGSDLADTPTRMPVSGYPSGKEPAAGIGIFGNEPRGSAPVSPRRAAVPSSPDGRAPAYFTTSIYQMAERFGKDLTPYENRHGDRDTVAPAMTIFDKP